MKTALPILFGLALSTLFACSSDSEQEPADDGDNNTSSSSSGEVSSSSGGEGSSSGEVSSSSGGGGGGGGECTAARAEALNEQASISTGAVSAVADDDGPGTLLFVAAHAGGSGPAPNNPRVYLNLGSLSRVEVSDVDAQGTDTWDLAIKRTQVFTNGGTGGSGQGAAQTVAKPFGQVTAADATDLQVEDFFDEDCKLIPNILIVGGVEQPDPSNFASTLAGWYDYGFSSHGITPKPDLTFIVRGGQGALYKIAFESFYGTPDGDTEGETSGNYLLRVAALGE